MFVYFNSKHRTSKPMHTYYASIGCHAVTGEFKDARCITTHRNSPVLGVNDGETVPGIVTVIVGNKHIWTRIHRIVLSTDPLEEKIMLLYLFYYFYSALMLQT